MGPHDDYKDISNKVSMTYVASSHINDSRPTMIIWFDNCQHYPTMIIWFDNCQHYHLPPSLLRGGPFNTRGEGMVFLHNQIIFFLSTRKHNILFLTDQKQTIFFLRYHRQTFFFMICLKIHSTAKQACVGR